MFIFFDKFQNLKQNMLSLTIGIIFDKISVLHYESKMVFNFFYQAFNTIQSLFILLYDFFIFFMML